MKTRLPQSLILFAVCFLGAQGAVAQDWTLYQSTDFNIQFYVPSNWATVTDSENGVPFLVSMSPDETVLLFLYSYKDASISTEELFNQTVEELGFVATGDYAEEDLNGLYALVGEGTGTVNGSAVGMFLLAATYDENNYVAYIFTNEEYFDYNAKVMNYILDSIAPIY